MEVHAYSPDAPVVAAQFTGQSVELAARVPMLVKHFGNLLLTRIMAKASGRPGPNAPTGDYRRSWNAQILRESPGYCVVAVGTNAPQGRRLEFGFHGADSLGRVYNQPPYPHVGPAMNEIVPAFELALASAGTDFKRGFRE